MSVGPRLFPSMVDLSDGSLNLAQALVIVTYEGDPLVCTRITVYAPDTSCVLDEPVAQLVEGTAPSMVSGRHEFRLVSGVSAWVLVDRAGSCCGSRLRSFSPTQPATSGPRP